MKKEKLIEYFAELLIIMVGVFLGMLITDWNAQRKLNTNRNEVLKSISRELQSNKEQIQNMLESRSRFSKSYDSLMVQLTSDDMDEAFMAKPFNERLPNWRGIGDYSPDQSMFDAAKYSNVLIGMDISVLEHLTKIYRKQESLQPLQVTFLDKFFQINYETRYGEVDRMIGQLRQELWGNQYLLIRQYDDVISLIDQTVK